MEITVNQKNHQINDHCSVEQLLHDVLSVPVQGLAVAINQKLVFKSEWASILLAPGDRVMLIKATQGG